LVRYWTNPGYREKRKATKRAYGRKRLQIKRDVIADALGGWRCGVCGNSDRDVLTFDHKDGHGEAERNQMGGQFPTINYYFMNLNEAKRKLQVLCANCNWRKNFDRGGMRGCASVSKVKALRSRLIELLGGPTCVDCGESDERILTIDHILGGGTADRKSRGGYPHMLHYYLKHPQEAKKKLEIRCRNCN